MSQDTSHNLIALSQPEGGMAQSSAAPGQGGYEMRMPIDSYADRLMDDLFEDVERLLEGGSTRLPTESASPAEYVALQPLKIPQFLPVSLLSRQDHATSPAGEMTLATTTPSSSEKAAEKRGSVDRLLLWAGCISVTVTLVVWLASHYHTLRNSTPVPVAQTQPTVSGSVRKVQAEAQLADYIQRSLKAINQKAATNKGVAVAPAPQLSAANLPTVPVAGTLTPTSLAPAAPVPANPATPQSNQAVTQVPKGERVYIPVYLPPNVYPAAGTAVVAPVAPQALAPQAAAPQVSAPATQMAKAPVTPGIPRTLVGVLELGDRSAALIETNGATQRFYLGESIGSSGWTLVEISKQEAIIRRNGEVRSVYIGQKF